MRTIPAVNGKAKKSYRPLTPKQEPEAAPQGEFQEVHKIKARQVTATVWQREETGSYSVTLTRTFYSKQRGQYLSSTKLFPEDLIPASEALAAAYAWIQETEECLEE